MKTYPRLKALVFALSLTGLAACASPPEPPQPSGERVPVNQPQQQVQQPAEPSVPAPADDLQLIVRQESKEPVLLTSPRPAADTDLPRLNYRK